MGLPHQVYAHITIDQQADFLIEPCLLGQFSKAAQMASQVKSNWEGPVHGLESIKSLFGCVVQKKIVIDQTLRASRPMLTQKPTVKNGNVTAHGAFCEAAAPCRHRSHRKG